MKIEVLYFEGCPNHKPAVRELERALVDLGIGDPVQQVDVKDPEMAVEKKFLGSPSIRIDGNDLFSNGETDYSMRCRTFLIDGKFKGFPSREDIQNAIRTRGVRRPGESIPGAKVPLRDHSEKMVKGATMGAIAAGIAASACCVGPVVFALLGIGGAGALLKLHAYQPVFIALTAALLAAGFYFSYRQKKQCASGSICATESGSRWNRIILWVATGLVILFIAFPVYAGYLF